MKKILLFSLSSNHHQHTQKVLLVNDKNQLQLDEEKINKLSIILAFCNNLFF